MPNRIVPLLDLRDIRVVYRRRGAPPTQAVAGVTLEVQPGQIVGLVGESGCGKSSLAKVAVGLAAPTEGSVWFEGRAMSPLGRRARPLRDVRLQMVFQNPFSSLNPRRRVGDQIADALTIRDGASGDRTRRRVGELLELVGLSAADADRYPHAYSGGQRQRIAIARALAADPSMIILDEPLSSLDASAQAQIANLITRLSRQLGVGLLLISHDLAIVRYVADVVAVMYLGALVEVAAAARLWAAPLHPYTQALIHAIPAPDGCHQLPDAIRGEVPDPARPPAGCRFHPRCPFAFERCRVEAPTLRSAADGRQVACWLVQPGPDHVHVVTGPKGD
jgi:oligopeptide/dipeptide ABC transporter ATP-binding protein